MNANVTQALSRVVALAFPLITIVSVRYLTGETYQIKFFSLLTDVVILSAFLKFGVDSYLQSGRLSESRIEVDNRWKIGWIAILVSLLILSAVSLVGGSNWIVFASVLFVLISYQFSEIGRLQNKYLQFYMLKAPAAYIAVLCLFSFSLLYEYSFILIGVAAVALIILAQRKLISVFDEINLKGIAYGWLVSTLVVLFSWKEAVISRFFFAGDELPEVVMYTRLLVVITFPFMLNNARIPNRLREIGDAVSKLGTVVKVVKDGRDLNLLWAVGSGIAIILFAQLNDPEHVFGVSMLMLSGVILVFFGNIQSAFIFMRSYRFVCLCISLGLVVFLALIIFLSSHTSFQSFNSIAIASISAQAFVGTVFWFVLRSSERIGDTPKVDK